MSQNQKPEPLKILWGAEGIAPVIGRTPKQTHALLSKRLIPGARKVGAQWCISEDLLRQFFLQQAA